MYPEDIKIPIPRHVVLVSRLTNDANPKATKKLRHPEKKTRKCREKVKTGCVTCK